MLCFQSASCVALAHRAAPPPPPCFVNGFASYSKACAGGLSITASFHYTSLVGSVLATVAASPTAAV